jgi:hypothetical protein
MSDYISREAASADERKHKIKTPFARIVVGGTPEKPCYDILYFDPTDGKCHIGFGSYRLDYVFRWLAEEFEVTEPAADVEPVRMGQWERCFEDWRQQIEGDKCSACGFEYYGTGIRRFHYCPNCGAKMEGGVGSEL